MTKFIFAIIILLALPQQSISYTCTNPQGTNIQLGKSAVICLHFVFGPSTTTPVVKSYAFKTTVDKFSALKVTGMAATLKNNTNSSISVVIQTQNGSANSQMTIFNGQLAGGVYRSVFSFVVNINAGNVTGITDDNADCGNCATNNGETCGDNTNNKCYSVGTAYNGVDPRFFISWIGTDIAGNYMLSHTKRLSRFTQYSIGSVYSKIVSTLQETFK